MASFADLRAELRGSVPKLSYAQTGTIINRAWKWIRESQLWSFNIFESAWITPPPVTLGGCTFTQGLATITFDATAIAAINASVSANPYAPVTVQQIRGGNVAGLTQIYNLISYNPITGAATLDRIWADPSGSDVSYTLFQCYYTPPMQDFLTWISVRNMQMFLDLELYRTKEWVDERDPQRSWYQFPTHVIPWGLDIRGQGTSTPSATLGYPLYELWGVPVNTFTYACYGLRRGLDLVNPGDTLPFQISSDTVMALARYYAYEWCEANKDATPRQVGPNFQFLMKEQQDLFEKTLLVRDRKQDRELINNYQFTRCGDIASRAFGFYNTIANTASPYTPAY